MTHLQKFTEVLFSGPHKVRFIAMDEVEERFESAVRGEHTTVEIQSSTGDAALHVRLDKAGACGGYGFTPAPGMPLAAVVAAATAILSLVEVARELQSLVLASRLEKGSMK